METTRKVPFFDYPYVFQSEEETLLELVRDTGRRGAYIMQSDLREFERNLAALAGSKHAVGVANATDGLQMTLIAGGIASGDEVIFCSHTMVATASAIHFAGGVPIPVEAGPDHLMDPTSLADAVTEKTRAIVVTQLNGRTADMDAIGEIAGQHGLDLYEDAAQALGSTFKGRGAGTFGVGACISFYPAKNLGCLGDGGAVLCNDDEVYEKLMLLRDHGRGEDGEVELWGFNSRLDNIQAAILNHRLTGYSRIVERRRALARLYRERLEGLPELVLPPGPDNDPEHFDVFQNYEIEAERRGDLKAHMAELGVGTLVQWGGKAVHQFAKLGFDQDLPYTDRLFERMLMLPMNMALSDDDVEYVCQCIHRFYKP